MYPTIICTTENIPEAKIALYEGKGIKILRSGKSNRVDIVNLMPKLYDLGVKLVLLEGGGTLNWSFFKDDLIDEIRLTIAPWVVGGKNAVSLVDGEGFSRMSEAKKFSLIEVQERDNYVVLKYKRGNL